MKVSLGSVLVICVTVAVSGLVASSASATEGFLESSDTQVVGEHEAFTLEYSNRRRGKSGVLPRRSPCGS